VRNYSGGKGYYLYLEKIKHYLNAVRRRGFQEEVSIEVINFEGRCKYDKCKRKNELTDKGVLMTRFVGREMKPEEEISPFHSDCLESLLKDKRSKGMN